RRGEPPRPKPKCSHHGLRRVKFFPATGNLPWAHSAPGDGAGDAADEKRYPLTPDGRPAHSTIPANSFRRPPPDRHPSSTNPSPSTGPCPAAPDGRAQEVS